MASRAKLTSLPLASKNVEPVADDNSKKDLVNVTIRISPTEHRKLKQLALNNDVTMQSLIKEALAEVIVKYH